MPSAKCPDDAVLRRFMLGRIVGREAEMLELHVAVCPACESRIEITPAEDELVAAMRDRSPVLTALDSSLTSRLVDRMRAVRPPRSDREVRRPQHEFATDCGPVTKPQSPPQAFDFLDSPGGPDELGRIGDYRVRAVLGSGGMGVVFRADDPKLGRTVALKLLLDTRCSDPRYVARFRAEATAVARLQHPAIVQVYETGVHRGRPYLALEYVPSGTLAEQLGGRPQPPTASADLVARLAEAVQHAHEQGVIHRDLKPGNVLLAADGSPKLTDFGLAKLPDDEGMTRTGDILGTPSYMAPESTSGEGSSGPALDIYALGAILYEMVTGRPPFRAATALETLEQVRTVDPVAPGRLQPGLSRDLETICLRCLEKTASRRYGSAQQLADDLGRFLRGEPVRARPVGPLRRLTKWARRQPTIAALALVSIIFGVAFLIGVLRYNAQLRDAAAEERRLRERARRQYDQARDTVRQMLARADARGDAGIPRLQELRRDQQEDALAFFLRIAADDDLADPDIRFEAARARHQAGLLQIILGRPAEASASLERARAELAALVRDHPDRGLFRFHLVDVLKLLGSVGETAPQQAESYLREAIALAGQLVSESPKSIAYRSAQADARMNLGGMMVLQKRFDEADELYGQAAAYYEEAAREQPESWAARLMVAKICLNRSQLMNQARGDPAAALHERAEKVLEALHDEKPNDHEVTETLAALRVNWSYVLRQEGKHDAALADLAKNLEMLTAALKIEPKSAMLRDRLFRTHGVRAETLENLKRFADAAREWQRVIELADAAQADHFRLIQALAYARAGEHGLAAAGIDEWDRRTTAKTSADQLYHSGVTYAVALQALRVDKGTVPPESDKLAERYAARAVVFLGRAREAYGPEVWSGKIAGMVFDPDLQTLAKHEGFKRLLSAKAADP